MVRKFYCLLDVCLKKTKEPEHKSSFIFVISGSFLKGPKSCLSQSYFVFFEEKFKQFFKAIEQNYSLMTSKCKFIFVPSHDDPISTLQLPKGSLPMGEDFITKNTNLNVHFTSNPSRIKYFTQEIVIFRDDLMSRMQRNCIVVPTDCKNEEQVNRYHCF